MDVRLQRLRRAPLSLLLHLSSPIQANPSRLLPRLFSPFDPYPLHSFSRSFFCFRSLILPCYESSVRVAAPQNSWASRSLSCGSANLVLANGKPRSETHETGPLRKEEEEEQETFPNANGRRNCKVEKVCAQRPANKLLIGVESFCIDGSRSIHTSQLLSNTEMEAQNNPRIAASVDDYGNAKVTRKKLKGKRAVVRWLKFFRWKKKKEYERMTAEEKILYKLKKAQKKEERLVEKLKKIEPSDSAETIHDPEILTPEEHFYFLKMGQKCKNYVPVGRRGIFQGVILNMHLHWKKHQTLKVVVKTFTLEEVREIAAELARLSGGIVLDIQEDRTIIMYRGKNYAQPPTEIMSPKVSLSRKKALDKSKYRDSVHAVRRYIPRLKQDLEDLQAKMKGEGENKAKAIIKEDTPDQDDHKIISDHPLEDFEELEEQELKTELQEDDSQMDSSAWSESEDLSDIFETDTDEEMEEKLEKPLYLDEVDRFPSQKDEEPENFEEHLREIAAASKRSDSSGKHVELLAELDEIDKIFLRAGSLLKRKQK